MIDVRYMTTVPYRLMESDRPFPILAVRLTNPTTHVSVDVDGYLDSGAEHSVFRGDLAATVGLDLLAGRRIELQTAAGTAVEGRLHPVVIGLDGHQLHLDIAFAMFSLRRNLLGRSFFDLTQVGFREHWTEFYLTVGS